MERRFLFLDDDLAVSFLLFTLQEHSAWLQSHNILIGILIAMGFWAICGVMVFPAILIITFFAEGIKVIRHEGMKPKNLLSMLFSVFLCIYLAVWPHIGNLAKNTISTMVYLGISFAVVYILSLFAMYSMSAVLNLVQKQNGILH